MMRVKICGITNSNDALSAIEFGTDALGFVFAESPRRVTKEQARDIIAELPPFVSTVGVFVNEKKETITDICKYCGITTIQLHGNEPPSYLEDMPRFKVIKAFRIKGEHDLETLALYKPHAFLLDSYVKGVMGGTGTTFNWEIAKKARKFGAIILSGGLTPDNVKEAIRAVSPYAVDVSSGVESSPGKKDASLMKEFITNAKWM
ncbi:MAG: phosphoribosylanthranilate isomerase [Candidatus Kuenenia sp.]|nr:phosphoribosylanthranilate isomerase [Candidatus Kuenenia hertensis]